MKKGILCILCVFLLLSFTSYGKHNGDYLNKLTTEYITPHLEWATPLACGKPRVLFIVPRQGAREVIEVWERMDIDFTEFITHSSLLSLENVYEGAIEGTSTYEKTEEIIKKLDKEYDVIVFGNVPFDIMPVEAQYKIIQKVENGTGLIFFYNHGTKYKKLFSKPVDISQDITDGISISGLPITDITPEKLIKGYEFGKGTIIILDYPGRHSTYYEGSGLTIRQNWSEFWKAQYENNMVLVLKTILYACGKEQKFSIFNYTFDNGYTFSQEGLPDTNLKFSIIGKGEKLNVKFRVRDEWNDTYFEKEFSPILKELKAEITYSLPFLKEGKYYLDYIIQSDKGVENFGYYTFNVKSSIGELALNTDKISYEKGEEIKGKIDIENGLKEGNKIVLKLKDSPYKKVWFIKELSISGGEKEVPFKIEVDEFPTIAGYLECEVHGEKGVIAKKGKYIFFPKRETEIFPSYLWGGLEMCFTEFVQPQILKAGFTSFLAHPLAQGENAKIGAIFNLKFVPYMYRIMLHPDENGWTQEGWLGTSAPKNKEKYSGDGSFYSPVVQAAAEQEIVKRIENIPLYGPLVYSLGDENYFRYNGGYSPSEEKEYREYLKAKYKTIEELNKEWEVNFRNFGEVIHYKEDECRKDRRYSAWYDNRCFMEKQYADYHHYLAKIIKGIDPYAKVGAEGSYPGNLEYTISKLEFWGPYAEKIMNEVLRSIGPGLLKTNWWGGYVDTHGGRDIYPYPLWRPLLCGIVNGNAWFTKGPSSEGFLSVDFTYAEYFKNLLPRLKKLYDGSAQLLVLNKLKKDGIAVHWSHTSYSASFMDERFFSPVNSSGVFIDFCYRNGLNFDFLTTDMIEKGKLKDYKVLFLFGSSAISEKEKEEIEVFVRNGGVVVADLNPGILNGYCRYLGEGCLNNLFNTTIKGETKFELSGVDIDKKVDGQGIKFNAKKVLCSPEIEKFVVNNYGKGTAILLNFNLVSAENTSSPETPFDRFVFSLLSLAEIRPEVEVKGVEKETLIIRVRDGDRFKILGILVGKQDIGKDIEIALKEKAYIYKVDEGFYGYKERWSEKIKEPFLLYSIFSEEQKVPSVKLTSEVVGRGENLGLKFEEDRFYRIEVLDSKDERIYEKFKNVANNDNEIHLRFAYSDIPGNYRVLITDIATGLKKEFKIKVK